MMSPSRMMSPAKSPLRRRRSSKSTGLFMSRLSGLFKYGQQKNSLAGGSDLPELSDEQLHTFRETFELFDSDGGGSIDADELGEVMAALGYTPSHDELDDLVKAGSARGDGEVNFEEFCKMMQMVMISHDSLYDLKLAFEVFDLDGSGSISRNELRAAIFEDGTRGLSEEDFDAIMYETDTSGDGEIDFQEV